MDKKTLLILPIVMLVSLIFLSTNSEAVVTACAMNVSTFNLSPAGVLISGSTVTVNWTVVFGSNSDTMNVTNVTIFKNNTRQILCQNLSLRINTTNTKGNCTFDSTSFVDDDAFTMVGEAYFANSTAGNPGRCTNISFTAGMNLNNTAPSISGAASNGKIFTGIGGSATDNLTIIVDNATRNCTLTIGNSQGQQQQLNTVLTKSANAANCTYQPVSGTTLPDGSYWVRWSAFDGLDTRFSDFQYTFDLKEGGKAGDSPVIDVAAAVGKTEKNNKDMKAVGLLLLIILATLFVANRKK